MKDIRQVREQWTAYLKSISSFEALQAASLSEVNITHGLGHDGLRSLLWKSLLLCHKLDISTLLAAVRKERSIYEDHKRKYLRAFDAETDSERFAGADPLADDESSPWKSLRQDEELRAEIQKDVDRTHPDDEFFRSPDVQTTLSNVLFVWSRLFPDISYRQGMHELAAPVYWVVHGDALDDGSSESAAAAADTEDEFTSISIAGNTVEHEDIMKELLDEKFIEHDTFSVFQRIMLFAKSWYEMGQGDDKTVGGVPASSPIVRKSEYIHEGLLGAVDPELAVHLDKLGVLPQIFLIRWIRLMFGREFTFEQTLALWDGIFVEDPTLQIIDYVCVAMLLRIRWKLLESDYSTALTLVLRYEYSQSSPPLSLLKDAIHLRDDLSHSTASKLILKYTSKIPNASYPLYERASTPPPRPHGMPASPRSPSLMGAGAVTNLNLNNIENLVHDVASKMRDRSERWGVNKALREAVGEVKRVSAGVGEQQREIFNRWKDSVERQSVLGGILEESIKALEAEESDEKVGDETSNRRKDAIERIKYVRNCLVDGKTTVDRRWLTEIPDSEKDSAPLSSSAAAVESPKKPSQRSLSPGPIATSRRSISAITSSPSSASHKRTPSLGSKPPPFPTYFSAGQVSAANDHAPPDRGEIGLPEPIIPPASTAITITGSTPVSPSPPVSALTSTTTTPRASGKSPSLGSPLSSPTGTKGALPVLRPPGSGPAPAPTPRRSLAQSQFAWMLGDDAAADKNKGGFGSGSAGTSSSFSGPSSGTGGGSMRKKGGSFDASGLFGNGGGEGGGLFG